MRAVDADTSGSRPPSTPGPAPGARVVVRRRLPSPDPLTGATLTDVVGDLVAATDTALVVATRRGEVRVDRADVELVHEVPPAPSRRGASHRALSVDDLQRVMVGAWPAPETEPLGQWLLRAGRGFTQRANSVVTTGDPGLPLAAAVDHVERWYADRGLPANLTLAGPVGADPADDVLGALLLGRGYAARVPTVTLTASAVAVASSARAAAGRGVVVATSPGLTDTWFDAYRSYREVDEEAARAVLTGSPAQELALATSPGGDVLGIGRLAVASAWGGVAAMWVAPSARRRGVAAAVLATLAERALAHGTRSLHLQTDSDNDAALGLYRRHGFGPHHAYVNLRHPSA